MTKKLLEETFRRPLLLLCSLLLAQGSQAQMRRYDPNFIVSERNFCDTIPIDVEDGQVLIPVHMGGETYRFLLDTGSGQGMVYQGCRLRGLTNLGSIVSHDANNRTDTVAVVQLPPFAIRCTSSDGTPRPPLTISGYVASQMPRRAISTKYDAVIGFDLFQHGLCGKIDTERRHLILTDRRKFFTREEAGGYGVKYKLKWWVPYLYVSPFASHTDEVLFDTGSRELYTMNKQSFDEHAANDLARLHKRLGADIERQVEGRAEGRLSIGGFGTEEKDEVVFLHLDRLKWGDFALTDLRAVTTQGVSKVGSRLLQYGTLIVNPFRKTLTLQPYATTNSVLVGNEAFNIAFVPIRGQATVGLIREGSRAYEAGFRQGDIVLQIDRQPILTFADFTRFRFVKGERHRFRLRRADGSEKSIFYIMTE